MFKRFRHISVGTFLNLAIGLAFIVAAALIVWLVNYHLRQQALLEAESKARLLLDRSLATHAYFSHDLKPKLFELTAPLIGDDYFDPTWMSSTYAVREIDHYFKALSPVDYYYKEAAVDARSPENEADAFERAFIKELNTDPELESRTETRVLDDQISFVTLRRGETMEASCLRCHDTPDRAPDLLVSQYGPERSFNRQVGDVVSAISIRVPLATAYGEADRFSLRLSGLLLLLLVGLFGVQFWAYRRLVLAPLTRIGDKATQISTASQHLGQEILLPPSKELEELTTAFNTMFLSLRRNQEHLEERVQERTAELEAANEEIKNFAYIVSHDLRAPLVNLKGFTAELRSTLENVQAVTTTAWPHLDELERRVVTTAFQEDVPEALGFIEAATSRMDGFINALLELSRTGGRELCPEPVDVEALVRAALQNLAYQIEQRGARVTVGPLPQVVADPTALEQIVDNLLDNAVKYLDPDRPGEIKVSAELGETETTFHFRDNGRGIAAHDTPKVFAPFRRAGPQDVPGEGMGLAYVQALVRRHGGRLWCKSQLDVGSTFTFTIPHQLAKGAVYE